MKTLYKLVASLSGFILGMIVPIFANSSAVSKEAKFNLAMFYEMGMNLSDK